MGGGACHNSWTWVISCFTDLVGKSRQEGGQKEPFGERARRSYFPPHRRKIGLRNCDLRKSMNRKETSSHVGHTLAAGNLAEEAKQGVCTTKQKHLACWELTSGASAGFLPAGSEGTRPRSPKQSPGSLFLILVLTISDFHPLFSQSRKE